MSAIALKMLRSSCAIFLCLFFVATQVVAQSAVDSVYPTLGRLGTDLDITVTGSGLDIDPRVTMFLDSGNSRLIRGELETQGNAKEVVVVGDKAYVVNGRGSLEIIDVSRRSAPVSIGFLSMPLSGRDIAVVKQTAYIAVETTVDGVGEGRLLIADASNPENPLPVGDVVLPDRAFGVAVAGNFAYVADWNSGLQIIDISDPVNPLIISSIEIIASATDVKIVNRKAYVAHHEGLDIIDVRNPGSLVTLPTWRTALLVGCKLSTSVIRATQ